MDMPSGHDHAGHAHHHPPSTAKGDGLKDPVCGMAVTERSAHHVEHEGRPDYFCSAKCRTQFVAEPTRYARRSVAPLSAEMPAQAAGTVYTCPMHPEIRQNHPGSCPKCGMTLEPVLPALGDEENPERVDFTSTRWRY